MDVSQYLDIFLDEAKEHLQNLNTQVLELEQDSGSELVELFRFFPDGGASGMRELIFKYHTFQKKYIISPLTGRIFAEETEE